MGRIFFTIMPIYGRGRRGNLVGLAIGHWKRKRLMRSGINHDRRGENKYIIEVVDVGEVEGPFSRRNLLQQDPDKMVANS